MLSVLESFTPTGTTLLSTRGHNERGVKRGNDKRREMKSAWKGAANVHGDNYARSNAMYPPETVAIHWRKLDYPTAFKKLKRIVELEYNFVYGYYSMRKEKKKKGKWTSFRTRGFSNKADCDLRWNLERNFYEPVENFYFVRSPEILIFSTRNFYFHVFYSSC